MGVEAGQAALVGDAVKKGAEIEVAVVLIISLLSSLGVVLHKDEQICLAGAAAAEAVLTVADQAVSFKMTVDSMVDMSFKHPAQGAGNTDGPI